MGQAAKKEAFMREPRLNRVCVCEDLDFYWDESELKLIRKMWMQELPVQYMADYFDWDPDEVVLAILHLAREERISKRKSGLLEGIIGCFVKRHYSKKGEK